MIGDVMIDRYISGKVDRISPEAPVPIVHLEKEEMRLGGAANVALNIKALGANPILCSIIGKDENANQFLKLLPKNGISEKGILQSAHRRTTVKSRVIAGNQHLLRIDREDKHYLNEEEEAQILKIISKILNEIPIQVIIFQDYNKGVLSERVIKTTILEGLKRNIPIAVDPKHHNFWAYQNVQLFKPNLKEVRDCLPFEVSSEKNSLRTASIHIRKRLKNHYTIITLSADGIYLDQPKDGEIYPTQSRSVADVCGAGDSVISIASLGLALNIGIEEIVLLSNLAGGQVCEKVGVVPINKQQLEKEYLAIKDFGNK